MDIKICQTSVRGLIEWLSTGWAYWAGSVSATTFGRPGMCRALESLVSWYPGQDSP